MRCTSPITLNGATFACGRCGPCRVNKKVLWSFRLQLEQRKHAKSSFITLTYSDEFLPRGGSLLPAHPSAFIKRLRAASYPQLLRYFLVGEYGDEKQRPHYHVALFGLSCERGGATAQGISGSKFSCDCPICGRVHSAWGKGRTEVDELNTTTANYICGYTIKKMTSKDDPRLDGRHPEFTRMSLKPGIGADAVADIADALFQPGVMERILSTGDVPHSLRIGGKHMPLGRYLRAKLRDAIGMTDGWRDAYKEAKSDHLRSLFYLSQDNPKIQAFYDALRNTTVPESSEQREQRLKNFNARTKLHEQRKKLS